MELTLIPDEDAYSFEFTNPQFITNPLRGGLSATRLDVLDDTFLVNVKFTCTREKFDYLQGFLQEYKESPQVFDMQLLTFGKGLQPHKAQIVAGSDKLVSVKGITFVVQMQLEAYLTEPGEPVFPPDVMGISFLFYYLDFS